MQCPKCAHEMEKIEFEDMEIDRLYLVQRNLV